MAKMVDKFALNNNLSPLDQPYVWLLSLTTSVLDERAGVLEREIGVCPRYDIGEY